MTARDGFVAIDGWLLTPECAIIHKTARAAIIADVHLGYEWARGKAGDCIPPHSLAETIDRLARLLARAPGMISELIVAGDLVESRRPCRRTDDDVRQLRGWLEGRGIGLVPLAGNHDRRDLLIANEGGIPISLREIGGWTVGHGHVPIEAERTISGHVHPVFRFDGVTAPCFLVDDRRIVLPAFSRNAAGLDVLSAGLARWPSPKLRCMVSTGDEVLDFGPISTLLSRTGSRAPFV